MGELLQFRPRPDPDREARLERRAKEIMVAALSGPSVPLGQEPTIHIDTSCSEMNPDQSA